MSENGPDDPKDKPDSQSAGSGGARQLFGHKGGAKPWEAPPKPEAVAEVTTPKVTPKPRQTSSAPYPRDATYTPRPSAEPAASTQPKSFLGEVDDEGELTRLHPNYKLLMRVSAIFAAVVIMAVAVSVETGMRQEFGMPMGVITLPALIIAALIAIRAPVTRFNARGYQISNDRLRVVRGVLFRSDTVVPFGRVQHIDVDQGPIERALDIATLTLHTAGSHNSSVSLPGLGHELAVEMREEIRAHIKRESL